MKNKTVLITGATNGIGKATAMDLALKGASLIIVHRNEEKVQLLIDEIKERTSNSNIKGVFCDLESIESINDLVSNLNRNERKIDILINNAGTWQTKYSETKEGNEKMFMVNFLAPYLLMKGLHDLLKAADNARIINVSSMAHKFGKLIIEDPQLKKSFRHIRAYSNSKLLLLLSTMHFAKLYKDDGIMVNALHPGVVNTGLFDTFSPFLRWLTKAITISPEKGAQTTIFLASSASLENISGGYYSKSKLSSTHKDVKDDRQIELAINWAEKFTQAFD